MPSMTRLKTLEKLTSTVAKNINEAVSTLKSEMNIISNENDKIKEEINILKVKIDNQATHLDYALNEAKSYKSMWKESMIWCNNIEQYGRRWSLRIHGHPQKDRNEDCKKEVVDIIKRNFTEMKFRYLTEDLTEMNQKLQLTSGYMMI